MNDPNVFFCLCDGWAVQICSKHKNIEFLLFRWEYLSKSPLDVQNVFKNEKIEKNVHFDSRLVSDWFIDLKHVNLLDFHGNFRVLATDPIPKQEIVFFIQKNQSRLEVAFLQNQSIWLKKVHFFQKKGKSGSFGENRKLSVFSFLKIKQIDEIQIFENVANWSSISSFPLACATSL